MNGAQSPLAAFWAEFRENWIAVAALAVVVVIVFIAVFAPLIAPQDPYDLATLSLMDARRPPGHVGSGGYVHLLGTDDVGQDLFAQLVYGARTSLLICLGVGVLAVAIGVPSAACRAKSRTEAGMLAISTSAGLPAASVAPFSMRFAIFAEISRR